MWYKDAIFYELNVRAFADSNGDGHGDFIGLYQKVDYLADLGVDCVWLMPFYPSPLRDDGYDVSDYRNIAPAYGTLADFKQALDALHERGMRVIIDLVINHTSDQHSWFVESRSSKDNPKRDWYVWSPTDHRYREARIIFVDTEDSNWTYDETTQEYYWHRFYKEQPDLNFDNPEVRQEMLDTMRFWLDMGIDGFRVDAVPYLFERDGTTCENLKETHDYIKEMRTMVKLEYPDRILLAEANQWPQDLVPYLDDEFDMAFHFPIMPRLFMGVRQASNREIIRILEQTPPIPPETQWCVFLRNHDELTLEMVTHEQREWMWQEYAPDPRMRINLGIRRRLAPLLDNDPRRILLLHAILFALPGSPILYYGDEIGMGDNIHLFDRNGVRTPMQWDTSQNAGFSSADQTYLPVVDDAVFGYRQVNVAAQQADPDSLFHALKQQIAIRKQYPVFGRGQFQVVDANNEAIFAFERQLPESIPLLVLANLSDQEQTAIVNNMDRYRGLCPKDILSSTPYHPVTQSTYTVALQPYGYLWLRLDSERA